MRVAEVAASRRQGRRSRRPCVQLPDLRATVLDTPHYGQRQLPRISWQQSFELSLPMIELQISN